MKRTARRLAICALLAPLIAEGLVRVRAYARYGAYLDIYEIHESHPRADILVPRPNLSILFARRARIETDSRGFRSPEVELPRPDGTLRLAFLGGSTTFCGEARSNETTWPHLLWRSLGEELEGVRFDYLNAGVTGYGVEDSRRALHHRLRPMQPDVVVIVHAAKDLAADAHALALREGLVEERARGWLDEHSLLWMLARKNMWYTRSQELGRSARRKLDYDPRVLSTGFRERLTRLVREAQGIADVVVLATYATKTRREQPADVQLDNLAQAFTFTPFLTPAGILDGYDEYNRVIAEVAEETGAVLVDGRFRIPGDDEHFSDSVHFTERGYEAMAQRMLDGLLASEELRALVAERRGSGPSAR